MKTKRTKRKSHLTSSVKPTSPHMRRLRSRNVLIKKIQRSIINESKPKTPSKTRLITKTITNDSLGMVSTLTSTNSTNLNRSLTLDPIESTIASATNINKSSMLNPNVTNDTIMNITSFNNKHLLTSTPILPSLRVHTSIYSTNNSSCESLGTKTIIRKVTNESVSVNKTTMNINNDSDCVIIENLPPVIVVNDDDDDDNHNNNNNKNVSLEDGEIVSDMNSSTTIIPSTPEPNQKNLLYYEDKTPGNSNFSTPTYDLISTMSPNFTNTTNEDEITMQDTVIFPKPIQEKSINPKSILDENDSVIFVSETICHDSKILDNMRSPNRVQPLMVPLPQVEPQRRRKKKNTKRFGRLLKNDPEQHSKLMNIYNSNLVTVCNQRNRQITTTRSTRETATNTTTSTTTTATTTTNATKRQSYDNNVYNPNKEIQQYANSTQQKRMIIIDGSNVAYAHSCNNAFSVKGIQICLDYFKQLGHEVQAVVPQNRLKRSMSTDPDTLEKLHREGKIVMTPCKNLPGRTATSYDDRYILQVADEFDAAIVSNDNYRDLLFENPAWRRIIENRVIGFSWCKDFFILAKDPYGKRGPTLNQILNRWVKS